MNNSRFRLFPSIMSSWQLFFLVFFESSFKKRPLFIHDGNYPNLMYLLACLHHFYCENNMGSLFFRCNENKVTVVVVINRQYLRMWVKCVSRSQVPRWNCRDEIKIVCWTENKRKPRNTYSLF